MFKKVTLKAFQGNLDQITNIKLKNTADELFRDADKIPGGTAGAIRQELKTGEFIGGKSHILKGQQRVKNLEKVLREEDLSVQDRIVANQLLKDLQNALAGK